MVFASMYPASRQDAYNANKVPFFSDSVIQRLLTQKPIRRLANIGFLGAIDYVRHGTGRAGHRRRHNRLEHSLAVAHLAEVYANEAGLEQDRRRLLLCAALLHDIGHGPLSHTLEPVFSDVFGINHHLMTRKIITGDIPAGKGIAEILFDSGVDVDEVLALIEGNYNDEIGHLFSGQINLDTLEGITRCRAFIAPRNAFSQSESIVRTWASGIEFSEEQFDEFWALKHEVYNLFIGASRGAALDLLAQTYMKANLQKFSPEDFQISEATLRKKHPDLYRFLAVSSDKIRLKSLIPSNWLEQESSIKKREFFVEKDNRLEDNKSINRRYKQKKTSFKTTLADLLE